MFTLYSIALFVHIVGALGMFVAIGIEWTFLLSIRNTGDVSNVKQWLSILPKMGRLHGPSWFAILIPGMYMAITVWGFQNWITITFALIFIMIILGAVLTGKRISIIGNQINKEDVLTTELQQKIRDKSLLYSITLRTAIALDIILLMTVKPDLTGSILSFIASVIMGFLAVYFYNYQAADKLRILNNNKA